MLTEQPAEFAGILRYSPEGWVALTWKQWMTFRDGGPLKGASGPTHMVVLIYDDDLKICNVIPHHYDLDGDGRWRADPIFEEIDRLGWSDAALSPGDQLRLAALKDFWDLKVRPPQIARAELAGLLQDVGHILVHRARDYLLTPDEAPQ